MITLNKKLRISGEEQTIEFVVKGLPEGDYNVQLLIEESVEPALPSKDYDLANWKSGITLNPLPSFGREELDTTLNTNNLPKKVDLKSWVSDFDIPPGATFSRDEIY